MKKKPKVKKLVPMKPLRGWCVVDKNGHALMALDRTRAKALESSYVAGSMVRRVKLVGVKPLRQRRETVTLDQAIAIVEDHLSTGGWEEDGTRTNQFPEEYRAWCTVKAEIAGLRADLASDCVAEPRRLREKSAEQRTDLDQLRRELASARKVIAHVAALKSFVHSRLSDPIEYACDWLQHHPETTKITETEQGVGG